MKRVLCLLENGFEEIEMITPADLLRRAGIEIVLASVSSLELTGKCGIQVKADALLKDLAAESFDALFLPGGPAVISLRKHQEILELIKNFHAAGKPIAAICAAPLLLKDAGVLQTQAFTCHFTTLDELPGSTGASVELAGNLLTSRGAGTALEFGFAFITLLEGETSAREVSEAIMA